jgi:hypothetical protein
MVVATVPNVRLAGNKTLGVGPMVMMLERRDSDGLWEVCRYMDVSGRRETNLSHGSATSQQHAAIALRGGKRVAL